MVLLTTNAPDDQDLLGAAMSHGPLCDLHQHGEHSLLRAGGTMIIQTSNKPIRVQSLGFEIICQNMRSGFDLPAGRNTGPLLYTDQNSASCEKPPVEETNNCWERKLR